MFRFSEITTVHAPQATGFIELNFEQTPGVVVADFSAILLRITGKNVKGAVGAAVSERIGQRPTQHINHKQSCL